MPGIAHLAGKQGVILGVRDEHSIAYICARALHQAGAEVMLTGYPNREILVRYPIAELGNPDIVICDIGSDKQIVRLADRITCKWGKLDFLINATSSPAQGGVLKKRLLNCDSDELLSVMDLSCLAFIRLVKFIQPLMPGGSCFIAVSDNTDEKLATSNVMKLAKNMLENSVQYLADELGPQKIKVFMLAVEAGEHDTVATHRQFQTDDVGEAAAGLVGGTAATLTRRVIAAHYSRLFGP